MKKLYFVSCLFILFSVITFNSFGQSLNSSNGIQTNILNTTPSSTTVEFILNHYDESTVEVNGLSTVFYNIPGSIWLMKKGFPQLPVHRASIIIPDLAGMSYRIVSQEFRTIDTHPVMPSKGHLTRDIDPAEVPYTFNDIYNENTWYPENSVSLDEPYIVRELRGQTVQFNPMQYNPAEGKLKICTRIVIEVFADQEAAVINPLVRIKPFTGVSREFVDVYKSLFINYGAPGYNYVPLDETGRLLIIYPSSYASDITPFYDWKVERGLTVITAEYPTETGTGSTSVKNYIQNLYNSAEGLTFVILVGESNQIPTMSGTYEGAPSDPCYVKLAGSDAYPDAFISRISPTSSDNLDYILYKLIKYEKYPDTGPNAGWYLGGTGVASNEDGGTGIYDWQRMNLLRDMLINNMFFATVDQIYDPGATSSQVTNALNDGRSIVNYIGHGSGTSWGTTGYDIYDIAALSNEYKNPFVLDVSCDNGDFTLSECMEEAWVRAGSMTDPKGAIGSFGASTLASWVPPCDMQYHAMFLMTTRAKQTIGGICFNGIMYAMDQWGGSSGEGLKLMEQYNIMGDCSMLLMFGMEPDSTAPDQITDLNAVDPTSNSVTLNWTSPYDSSFGGIVSYDLRYSVDPIVTEEDFGNATSIIVEGDPDTVGMAKSYTIHELNFSTEYYFAIKASDIWGNKSQMSNVPFQITWGPPQISVSPDSINCILTQGTTTSDSIIISNVSVENSTLDYNIELTNNSFPGNIIARIIPVNNESAAGGSKNNPVDFKGMSITGSGGPDIFGYEWIDSNDPQGPVYEWNDISETGTEVTGWTPTGGYNPLDEGEAGPIPIGFNFKFYGVVQNQFYLSSNGFLSFDNITEDTYTNYGIPTPGMPDNIISPFWDDLDGSSQGTVYYQQTADKLIIQYTNWQRYPGTGSLTFQIVLQSNNKIFFYYNNMAATLNSCTVGIENMDGSDGLQIAYNAAYVEDNLAVMISAEPEWLIANNFSGTVYNGNSFALILNFITEGLELGNYSMDVVITSNDPQTPEWVVPVSMQLNEVPVELTSFVAENSQDAVILKWNTATEKNNMGFDIEKQIVNNQNSTGGNRNSENGQVWEKIGFVAGHGTTTEPKNYSYSDKIITNGTIQYRLKQIDFDGTVNYSNKIEIEVNSVPTEFALSQNYPNPFNPTTSIRYDVPVQSYVTLYVYDGLGQLVRSLVNEIKEPGKYTLTWNGRNNDNEMVATGFYICKIRAGNFSAIKKMLLLK
jgi:hypothetical protein